MKRIGATIGSAMLLSLFSCSGGSSNDVVSPPPASMSESASDAASLDGVWVADLNGSALESRGFSAKQIALFRRHDKWSSHQMNEISISGDVWILSQGADGDAPTPTDDYGHLSTTDDQLRLEDGACSLVLQYKVEGESLELHMLSSTCDEVPSEPIPDFMYSAVFGESFERQA
jgi:hypothetical protein